MQSTTVSAHEGFLSAEFALTVAKIRRDHSTWFGVLTTANRLAMDVLTRLKPGTADNQKVLEAVFYARGLQSIQAVVLLAKRGMTSDARTLLRACVETAILQCKISRDAKFADKLAERHDYHRRALGNAALSDPQIVNPMHPGDAEAIRATVDEINSRYPGRKPTDIKLAEIAESVNGMHLYNLFFRPMSGDAAHGNFDALNRHVVTGEHGEMTGLSFGPQVGELADTLSATISVLLHILDTAIESFALAQFRTPLANCLDAWKALVASR